MSVIVKGMQMPEKCPDCNFESEHGFCLAKSPDFCGYTDDLVRPNWCPLVELPEKHGDLIDRQKLLEDNKHLEYPTDGKYRRDRAWAVGFNSGARHCNEHAVYAPTVIEAEGTDEGSN